MIRTKSFNGCTRRGGFTLVELLVVIGIIALLISILLPSLGKAREAANKVKCASNLRSVGQSFNMFANAHKGRLPGGHSTPWDGPWWGPWMYSRDFFKLEDDFGMSRKVLLCPSVAGDREDFFTWGYFGTNSAAERSSRAQAEALRATPVVNGLDPGGNPDDPKWYDNIGSTGGLASQWVEAGNYSYNLKNLQQVPNPGAASGTGSFRRFFSSSRLISRKAQMGNEWDSNQPIATDRVILSPGNPFVTLNHGRVATSQVPSTPISGTSSYARSGEVSVRRWPSSARINVLYRDGHVNNKAPDLRSYYNSGPNWFFY